MMEVYLQESCVSHRLIWLALDRMRHDVWWDSTVGQLQLRADFSACVLAVGQMCPTASVSCPGPSTSSLATPSCKVDELHSTSHSWSLQRPEIGDLWEHVTAPSQPAHLHSPPKELGKSKTGIGLQPAPQKPWYQPCRYHPFVSQGVSLR